MKTFLLTTAVVAALSITPVSANASGLSCGFGYFIVPFLLCKGTIAL